MKKLLIFAIFVCLANILYGQTMNVVVGQVTYQIPASQAGEMTYQDGKTLTLLGKTFNVSDIEEIDFDESDVTDNTVQVTYNGTTAKVLVAGNAMQYLTITASGANVSILQSDDLADEITYTLQGTSDSGSFYMDGSLKASLILQDLTLTNPDSAAINIQDGKRISIDIEGTNTLKDSKTSTGKAALAVKGHTEFTGSGTLNLYGYASHGMWGKEYVQMRKSMTGSLNILASAGDGLNVNQYFEQNGGNLTISGVADDGISVSADDEETGYIDIEGGTMNLTITAAGSKGLNADGNITIGEEKSTPTLTIKTTGGGVYDTTDRDTKACACISSGANLTVNAGTLELTSTGAGGKGMKCDTTLTINGGTINVTTSGNTYTYSSKSSSAKGIKATGNIDLNGGDVTVTTSSAEGIESKKILTINDGTYNVTTYDDAINSASHMYIKGGTVNVSASNNDGLDSNGNLYIQGGTITAYGKTSPECGIDANEEQNYTVYITGGTLLAIGGGNSVPKNSTSTQAYITTTGSITSGNTLTVSNGTDTLATFTLTRTYSGNSGGGGGRMAPGWGGGGGNPGGGGGGGSSTGGSASIMVSCPRMVKGTTYTLKNGTTSSSVTAVQYSSSGK